MSSAALGEHAEKRGPESLCPTPFKGSRCHSITSASSSPRLLLTLTMPCTGPLGTLPTDPLSGGHSPTCTHALCRRSPWLQAGEEGGLGECLQSPCLQAEGSEDVLPGGWASHTEAHPAHSSPPGAYSRCGVGEVPNTGRVENCPHWMIRQTLLRLLPREAHLPGGI